MWTLSAERRNGQQAEETSRASVELKGFAGSDRTFTFDGSLRFVQLINRTLFKNSGIKLLFETFKMLLGQYTCFTVHHTLNWEMISQN